MAEVHIIMRPVDGYQEYACVFGDHPAIGLLELWDDEDELYSSVYTCDEHKLAAIDKLKHQKIEQDAAYLPLGCKECGWGGYASIEDMLLLCPRCHRPTLDLDKPRFQIDLEMQTRFDQAQHAARSRWLSQHSDH